MTVVMISQPETRSITVSQPILSPAVAQQIILIEHVCDVLNEHTVQYAGPLHDIVKLLFDIVLAATASRDERYIAFVSYLFDRVVEGYLRKPEPSVSVERLLIDLAVKALAHCVYERMALPDVVRGMLPCVRDALESEDGEYVKTVYGQFDMVVKGAIYGVPVWMEEASS